MIIWWRQVYHISGAPRRKINANYEADPISLVNTGKERAQDVKDPKTLANLVVCSLHIGKPFSRLLRFLISDDGDRYEFGVPGFGKTGITASHDLNEETLDALNKHVSNE
ncbi:hypothetical protein E3N88_36337 [Mikania micrantha]|uniref:Uncharacterized protein n=1 Tax=Mikania micrantha TaxID=192012 RepID=A0A5N6M3L0_9ASTR|nr:hypothetical protein E3N88_36337 [Mikania micrantha]